MVKKYTKSQDTPPHIHHLPKQKEGVLGRVVIMSAYLLAIGVCGVAVFLFVAIYQFQETYKHRIFPGVRIDTVSFGGKSPEEVETYFQKKTSSLQSIVFELVYGESVATISAKDIRIAYDHELAKTQAYAVGRSGHILSDIYQQWKAATAGIRISSILTMDINAADEYIQPIAQTVDILPQDALFHFVDGKVMTFKPSITGKKLDTEDIKKQIKDTLYAIADTGKAPHTPVRLSLHVIDHHPAITTEKTNTFGIIELIGRGTSTYLHSIPGRVHNVALAASRIHGHLIPPGETFSFNQALGDVSAATGYQQAYIIKNGRTVLGDGGGVCQVSTTLFRAVLNSGLPIQEHHTHSYRVSYYEQGSPLGMDATVFSPSYDFKFKNDTPHHILIQAVSDPTNYALTFEMYGTKDGRIAQIGKPTILSQTPAPPDLVQEDPTLPVGVMKQVDWKASGAKVQYEYSVEKNGQKMFEKKFFVTYQPWQAVFLKGTKSG